MQLNALTPNLMVDDLNITIDFYTKILGFDLILALPGQGTLQWAYLQKDDIKLMFQSTSSLMAEFPELETRAKGGALTLFLQVKNTEQWYQALQNKVKVIRPYGITAYNGAREFVIQDPDGSILHFSDISFT